MLELVKRSVAALLGPAPGPGWEGRILSLDTTRGEVDGYCFLVVGEDGSPLWVARAARTAAGKAIFRTDHENLVLLEQRGINAEGPAVPRPIDLREEGDTLVALQTALQGIPLKNVPGARLFGGRSLDATLDRLLVWWNRFHDCFGLEPRPLTGDLHDREVNEPVRRFCARFRLSPDELDFLEARLLRERRLEGRTLPLMARHGDFCTANMVMQPHGLGVFDWEFPLEPRLPLFDLFFLLSSTRFPFGGVRGESTHFESFVETYWGDSPFARAARSTVRDVAERQGIDADLLDDLFLVALIHVANMKYEALVEARGPAGGPSDGGAPDGPWAALAAPDKDVPFARIEGGALLNLGHLVRHGFPRF